VENRAALTREGIRIFNIFCWADALTTVLYQAKLICAVHCDPRDLSRVYVKDRQGEFIGVPYRTRSDVPVTLTEQRWATRKLRSENRIADERAMFEATAEGLSPRTCRKLFTPACTIHPTALVT
jgi:putative transposase